MCALRGRESLEWLFINSLSCVWFLWCSMFRWHWKVLFMCVLIFFFFFLAMGLLAPVWARQTVYGWCAEALRQWGYVCSKRKRVVVVIVLSLMKWLFCAWCDFSLTVGPSNVCLFSKMPRNSISLLETTKNVFSVLLTRYSKIKELSDENKFKHTLLL